MTHVKNFSTAQLVARAGAVSQPDAILPSEHGSHGTWPPRAHLSVSPNAPCLAPPRLVARCGVKHTGFGVKHIQVQIRALPLTSKLFKSLSFIFSSLEKWGYFLFDGVINNVHTCA